MFQRRMRQRHVQTSDQPVKKAISTGACVRGVRILATWSLTDLVGTYRHLGDWLGTVWCPCPCHVLCLAYLCWYRHFIRTPQINLIADNANGYIIQINGVSRIWRSHQSGLTHRMLACPLQFYECVSLDCAIRRTNLWPTSLAHRMNLWMWRHKQVKPHLLLDNT